MFSISSFAICPRSSSRIVAPSTIYNGDDAPGVNEPVPRIRTKAPCPGLPFAAVTCTPAALPCSILSILVVGAISDNSAAEIDTTADVCTVWFRVEYPVTTTSSKEAPGFNVTFIEF